MTVVLDLAIGLLILVALAVVAIGALHWRKVHLEELQEHQLHRAPLEDVPPSSPYEVSRGIRVLEANETSTSPPRPQPERPRLDPNRHYVFSDAMPPETEHSPGTRTRHDDHWALERSSRRSHLAPGSGKILIAVVIALLVLAAVGAFLQEGKHPSRPTNTTTTTVRHLGAAPTLDQPRTVALMNPIVQRQGATISLTT